MSSKALLLLLRRYLLVEAVKGPLGYDAFSIAIEASHSLRSLIVRSFSLRLP